MPPPVDSAPIEIFRTLLPLVAAVVGALFGFYLRGIEARRDELSDRVDDVVAEVHCLQDANKLYWSKSRQREERNHEDLASEGEMTGRLHIINLMVEDLSSLLKDAHLAELRASVVDLRQSTTGGSFAAERGRDADTRAIQSGYRSGHELILRLRRTRRGRKGLISRIGNR